MPKLEEIFTTVAIVWHCCDRLAVSKCLRDYSALSKWRPWQTFGDKLYSGDIISENRKHRLKEPFVTTKMLKLTVHKSSNSQTALFSYKNVVFSVQAEYSYFSADFSMKIFMYYSWIIIEKERIYHILFCGLFIYFVIIFLWLYTIDVYFMYRSSHCH